MVPKNNDSMTPNTFQAAVTTNNEEQKSKRAKKQQQATTTPPLILTINEAVARKKEMLKLSDNK